jgi:beta-glucanase (GH16 family)
MANVTLDEEFNSLGNPWLPTYPWSPNGWAAGDMGSFLANPALLPPDANPISVDNGVLALTDMPKPSDVSSDQIGGLSRIGGQVLTENQFSQTYGYFEARIQMPAGAGEGTDFWLLSQGGSWPPELDIAEMIGSNPDILVNTLHGDGAPDGHWMGVADMTQGFHTYAVGWEPDKITWYFDGTETFETPTTPDMHQPMYVVLSTGSGQPGSWPGAPDPSLVSQMKIDYVRVYDANPYTTGGALTASTAAPDTLMAPASTSPAATAPTSTDTGSTPTQDTTSGALTASTAVPDASTSQTPAPTGAATVSDAQTTAMPDTSTTTSNGATVVNIGTDSLLATPSAMFVFDGPGHSTSIQDFAPDSDKLDFEMTAQDFSNVSITAGSDGQALIDFKGNHVSLPGVTPDQLGQSNFLFDVNNGGSAATG